MTKFCMKCRGEIADQSANGRPKAYCSEGCRRSAEFEIKRINQRLLKLEENASNARLGSAWGENPVPGLDEEISRQETRLLALLDAKA